MLFYDAPGYLGEFDVGCEYGDPWGVGIGEISGGNHSYGTKVLVDTCGPTLRERENAVTDEERPPDAAAKPCYGSWKS